MINCYTLIRRIVFLVFLLFPLLTLGQSHGKISGKITDSDGQPIPQAYVLVNNTTYQTTTDEKGKYKIELPADTILKVFVSHIGFINKSFEIKLKPGEIKKYNLRLVVREMTTVDVVGENKSADNLEGLDVKSVGIQPSVGGGIEGMLKTTGIGVSSRDELSAAYSVRGGSYDENLIYVNGNEIYRPQLVRAGQEEGLSFINPNLVDNVYFSAGGFTSRYGDKMSSVLDVRYKKPQAFGATLLLSLLGAEASVEGASKDGKLSGIVGFRYKTTRYVLGTLDTEGEYQPNFLDLQGYLTYRPTSKIEIGYLGYLANNNYNFLPQSRSTELGNLSQALRLDVKLDGREESSYRTFFNALSLTLYTTDKLKLAFSGSAAFNKEKQSVDVQGLYILGELDSDLGSETFGDVIANRGIGAFIEHARNKFKSNVYSLQHNGSYLYDNKQLNWGLEAKNERIEDELDEWVYQDSSGYSVPRAPSDQIILNDIINANNKTNSNRYIGYVQNTWNLVLNNEDLLNFNVGIRGQYWTFNNQFMLSPRGNIAYKKQLERLKNDSTLVKKDLTFRFATGVYYQPPFYHEMRGLTGEINYDIRAQQAFHFIVGVDYVFFIAKRPFKWTTEIYYKPMTDLIPFQVDNIRLQYLAENNSKGYTYGLDMKLNGEFVKGIESFVGFSLLKSEENILDDFYYEYFDEDGQQVPPSNGDITDSTRIEPGYIPRPFDQRFSFNLFFQDEMPRWPAFKVHINLTYVSGFPFGPPDAKRYQQTLRSPPYRRVDIGFSYSFVDQKTGQTKGILKPFRDAWISLEVFNLIDINNVISYNWIKDVTGRQYAVPNYLTGRRINVKFFLAF